VTSNTLDEAKVCYFREFKYDSGLHHILDGYGLRDKVLGRKYQVLNGNASRSVRGAGLPGIPGHYLEDPVTGRRIFTFRQVRLPAVSTT
jgi:hypothetical protein